MMNLPPELKGAAAAGDEVFEHAIQCANLAADADPAKLPVTDDYTDALRELDTAIASRIVYQVRNATRRFSATFDLTSGMKALISRGAGMNELALLGAVIFLRGAIQTQDEAHAQLKQRFPDIPTN